MLRDSEDHLNSEKIVLLESIWKLRKIVGVKRNQAYELRHAALLQNQYRRFNADYFNGYIPERKITEICYSLMIM